MYFNSMRDSDRARAIIDELDCVIITSDKIERCLNLYHQMRDVLIIGKMRDEIAMRGLHSVEFLPLVSDGISVFTMERLKANDRKHHRESLLRSAKVFSAIS